MKRQNLVHITLLFITIFSVDRFTKWLACSYWEKPIAITSWLSFGLVYNRGVSWGILHDAPRIIAFPLFMLIASIIIGLVYYMYGRWKEGYSISAEVCVCAGALSNIFDRLLHAAVIDFIFISLGFWQWPVFNVADCAITMGVLWMIIQHFRES